MLERYYWRITCTNVGYTVILIHIFGACILTVCTDPLNGVEITQSPNMTISQPTATCSNVGCGFFSLSANSSTS